MKRNKLFFRLIIGAFAFATFILVSCQGFTDYLKSQFPELDSTTYIVIDGTLMAPIANSTKYISEFLPKSQDSTKFWIAVDQGKLIHIMARQNSVFTVTGADLGVNGTWPANTVFGPVSLPPIAFDQIVPIPSNIPGEIGFGDVAVKFVISNTLPLSINATIDSIRFYNTVTGQTDFYKTTINFTLSPANGSTPSIDTVVVDSTNFPQISQALAIKPDKVRFVISGTVPRQTPSSNISSNQSVTSDMLVDVPLYLYARDIVIPDTTVIDLPLNDSIIQDILVKAVVENTIPLGGKVYLAFVDSLVTDTVAVLTNPDFANSTDTLNILVGTKLVTLRPVIDLKPGETDAAGTPINAVVSVSKLHLSHQNIISLQKITGQKRLLIFAKFNTYRSDEPRFVKILSSNYLNIKLGAKVQYATSF